MKTLLLVLLLPAAGAPRQAQSRIDAAIKRGVAYLKKAPEPTAHKSYRNADELILLTLLHADVDVKDPFFQKLLKRMLAHPLSKTYKVALQAMVLEELHRVKHQLRIAECAQFLVDNQNKDGYWSYGRPTDTKIAIKGLRPVVITEVKKKKPRSGLTRFRRPKRIKPDPVRKIRIEQKRELTGGGDNSNSQYASLGLRACHDAGILLPKQVLVLARNWWVTCQNAPSDGADKAATATGGEVRPRGWNYRSADGRSTQAMTAGAIGAVVIFDYMLGIDWKKDRMALAGTAWGGIHFKPSKSNLYYMYAVERAGMLFGTETFGKRNWYNEGAPVILDAQLDNGAWGVRGADNKAQDVWKTCFAILFLKKATRAIATGDDRKR